MVEIKIDDIYSSISQKDLALLYIDKPFTESDSTKIIQMNDQYSSLEGKTATLSGWGKTESENSPALLSEITSMITKDGADSRGMRVIRMPNTAGSGVCQGDSGGNTFKSFYA